VALSVEASVEVTLVGSYRRGKQTCGDVDVLICRPDHIKPGLILPRILDILREKGKSFPTRRGLSSQVTAAQPIRNALTSKLVTRGQLAVYNNLYTLC